MRSIVYLHILILLVMHTSALGEVFDLGERGRLQLVLPEGWKAESHELGRMGLDITVRPTSDINASCRLTILLNSLSNPKTAEEIQKGFMASVGKFIPGSVEQIAEPIQLKLKKGTGVYACFTDSSLVGKPSQPRNYKVMAPGVLMPVKGIMVSLSMFTDDKNGPDFKAMVSMLESMTWEIAKSSV